MDVLCGRRDKRDKEPGNAGDSALAMAGYSSRSAASLLGCDKLRQARVQAWNSLVLAEHVMSTDPDMTWWSRAPGRKLPGARLV